MGTSQDTYRELLADLGEVCIQATWLEYALVEFVAQVEGHDDEWCTEAVSRTGGPIGAFAQAVQAGSFDGLSPQIPRFYEDARKYLSERNMVVHSVALTTAEGLVAGWWHPKSNRERPVSKEHVASVAHGLYRCYIECKVLAHGASIIIGGDPPETA